MSQYATLDDLYRSGFPETARAEFTDDALTDGLVKASGVADSHLRGRYRLPLVSYPSELSMYVSWIAAYLILSTRGFNPASGADVNLRQRYEDALEWLEGVQAKRIHPDISPAANQSPSFDRPLVLTRSTVTMGGKTATNRGW